MAFDIKSAVANGRKVAFVCFKDRALWYRTECGFEFPIPVDDKAEIGEATFLAEDKAILFMRWMRKHAKMLEDAKSEVVPA